MAQLLLSTCSCSHCGTAGLAAAPPSCWPPWAESRCWPRPAAALRAQPRARSVRACSRAGRRDWPPARLAALERRERWPLGERVRWPRRLGTRGSRAPTPHQHATGGRRLPPPAVAAWPAKRPARPPLQWGGARQPAVHQRGRGAARKPTEHQNMTGYRRPHTGEEGRLPGDASRERSAPTRSGRGGGRIRQRGDRIRPLSRPRGQPPTAHGGRAGRRVRRPLAGPKVRPP